MRSGKACVLCRFLLVLRYFPILRKEDAMMERPIRNAAKALIMKDGKCLQSKSAMEAIKTLNLAPLYPSRLRRQIMNLYEGKEYKVYLGNEEVGDPEITD